MEERFLISSCFLSGDNAEQSYANMYNWIDQVFEECGLLCTSKVQGSHLPFIPGYYQNLYDREANKFIQTLTTKLEVWAAEVVRVGCSCGAILRTSPTGKGALSITPQPVGPFRD